MPVGGQTVTKCQIDATDQAAFEDNGYYVLRNALTCAEVAVYREAFCRLLALPESHPYSHRLLTAKLPNATPENPRSVWAAFDLPLFEDCFFDLAYHPRIAFAVDALIGPDINLYETSSISKNPGFPGNFRDWHQDSEYSDPQTNDRNVTVIICLDDMNGESGATWVVPGSHKIGPLPHIRPTEPVSSGAREVADKQRFDAEGISFDFKEGDALIFLVRIVHKSGANHSSRTQMSLAYNYVRKDTLNLGEINHYIGASVPIVRNSRIYLPGQN